MKNMRFVATVLTVVTTVTSAMVSMPVYAAPKTMADGNIFDAEFYASNNADVVAAFGKDEAALYSHYINYGKKEGRAGYSADPAAKVAANSTVISATNVTSIAEAYAKSFAENDYKSIYSYASKFLSYMAELEPYKVEDDGAGSKIYNFATSKGPLMFYYYSGGDYNYILGAALGLHSMDDGQRIVGKEADYIRRNESSRRAHGFRTCSNYVYGKNTFAINDRWISYVNCKNGYKYMEISTDGLKYLSEKCYPNPGTSAVFPQSSIIHFCTNLK